MGDPDRGNLFSAWFLCGFGEATELGASPIHLGICPSVGRPVLLLGMEFARCLFNEEGLFLLKLLLQMLPLPLPLSLPCCLPPPVSSIAATPGGSPELITLDKSYSICCGQVYLSVPPD